MAVRVKITVINDSTGVVEDTEEKVLPENDYLVTTTGECYVAAVQAYPKSGTHVVTIKGRR